MSEDVFGQLCFFMFAIVPAGADIFRNKRIKLATIHCHRSECAEYIESFRAHNKAIGAYIEAEFSFREIL